MLHEKNALTFTSAFRKNQNIRIFFSCPKSRNLNK